MSGDDFPFFQFLIFHFLGDILFFSFSVPTQSVECSIFSFFANSGPLKKLSIHSVCLRPNKGSKSSSTTAVVLGVSRVIRIDCRTVFLPVYLHTRKHHKYPVHDSHSSIVYPSITPESTAERSALTESMQGEYQQLQNVC